LCGRRRRSTHYSRAALARRHGGAGSAAIAPMSRVLVTGAAGHLGRVFLPRLLADPRVTGVVAFDRTAPTISHPKLEVVLADIIGPSLAPLLKGADAVVHLAFVVLAASLGSQRRNRALMRTINVEGTRQVVTQAHDAGVRRLVYTSSVAVYGARPDNPPLIDENQPRRPTPGFAYAEDKAEVEDWLDRFEVKQGDLAITRLRLHAVVGPHALPLVNTLARSRFYVRVPDPQPWVQCVWEQDAASAILAALHGRPGVYNIAAPDPVSYRELVCADGRISFGVPFAVAERMHRLVWPLTGAWGDPGWLAGLKYPLAVSTARAATELGWRASYSVGDCVRAMRQVPLSGGA
jgi:UDP-glucose 4-epimerase